MGLDPDQLAPRAAAAHRLAAAEGFTLAGIAPATPSDHADWVRQWIADGRHGEMAYLERNLDVRLDPTRLLPGAQSVIVVADFYETCDGTEGHRDHKAQGDRGDQEQEGETGASVAPPPRALGRSAPSPTGRIARYALGDDYHKVMTRRLHRVADALRERFPDDQFKCTVDTAPILEREHAERAGLGWCGKNTLLIHPTLGSYMLLGTIVTTLKLQTTAAANYPGPTLPPTDHCGSCTRCIDACPTQCIADPDAPATTGAEAGHRTIDASRCISYLTLEHRGPIDPSLHPAMGDWLAGCDVCQDVCPFNHRGQGSRTTDQEDGGDRQPAYQPREPFAQGLELLEVLGWSAADRQEAFRGSALKRVKLDMLKRNALIAAGNALARRDDPPLRRRITALAHAPDEPKIVRTTAQQVLDRLAETPNG